MTAKPIIFTVVGAGVLGGSATSIYYFTKSNPKNIKELLINEKLTPLNTENDEDNETWKKLIKKHVTITGDNESRKIKGLSFSTTASQTQTTEDINKLKEQCKTLFSNPITTDNEFKTKKDNAIDWCTKQSNFARG